MALVDAQARRLSKKALEKAAKQMETVDISWERLGSGPNEASVSYFMITAEDGLTKQEFPRLVVVVLADTEGPRDEVARRILGRVPGKE